MVSQHLTVAAEYLVVHIRLTAVVVRHERRMLGVLLIRPGHVPVDLRFVLYMQPHAVYQFAQPRLVGEPLSAVVTRLLHGYHIPLIARQRLKNRYAVRHRPLACHNLHIRAITLSLLRGEPERGPHQTVRICCRVAAHVHRVTLQRTAADVQVAYREVYAALRCQFHQVVLHRIDGETVAYTQHLHLTRHVVRRLTNCH